MSKISFKPPLVLRVSVNKGTGRNHLLRSGARNDQNIPTPSGISLEVKPQWWPKPNPGGNLGEDPTRMAEEEEKVASF
jgi:hypothetical protein